MYSLESSLSLSVCSTVSILLGSCSNEFSLARYTGVRSRMVSSFWGHSASSRVSAIVKLDFTQNLEEATDAITLGCRHSWLESEGFSLSAANADVQELPATPYH